MGERTESGERLIDTGGKRVVLRALLLLLVLLCAGCGRTELGGGGHHEDPSCATPLETCGASGCVDTEHDPRHCGGCDRRCDPGALCDAGRCIAQCSIGQLSCVNRRGNLSCVDAANDPANCGACQRACPPAAICSEARCLCDGAPCEAGCGPGQLECATANPRCVDPASDAQNCGACGHVCPDNASCENGQCSCAGAPCCAAGLASCATPEGQAACVDLKTSRDHCGACEVTCATDAKCIQGQCHSCEPNLFHVPLAYEIGPLTYDSATPPQMVDVDGDGHLDVVVANTAGSSLTLYRGDGTGKLGVKESIDTVLSPTAFAVADYDLDGASDILVAGYGGVMIHWGRPSGRFDRVLLPGSPVDWASANFLALAVVDLAGDSFPELVLLAQAGGVSQTWLVPGVERYTERNPMLVATSTVTPTFKRLQVADFNADGFLDIAAWNVTGDVYWGSADGTWTTQAGFVDPGERNEVPLRYIDLNNDQQLDMVSALAIGQGTLLYGYRVRVRLGDAGGGFTLVSDDAQPYSDGLRLQFEIRDWNQDSLPDLLLREEDSSSLSAYAGRGDGTFELRAVSAVPAGAGGIASGDLDGDGLFELAALHSDVPALTVHRGLPGAEVGSYLLHLPKTTYLRSAKIGRYADQKEPLVAVVGGLNLDTGRFRVLRYDGADSLQEEEQLPIYRPQSLALTDVDGDGNSDALIAAERDLSWLRYEGNGKFAAQPELIANLNSTQDVSAADATGDGVPEVFARQSGASLYMFSRSSPSSPWETTSFSITGNARLAVGDVTGDSLADMVVVVGKELRVYEAVAGQAPQLKSTAALPEEFYQIQLIDLTGDGITDILVGNWSGYRAYGGGPTLDLPLLSNGMRPTLYYPYPVAHAFAANLDADRFGDLIESESAGVLSLWQGLGDGSFQRTERHLVPGGGSAVGVDDFDGDGIADLLLIGGSDYDASLTLLKGALKCSE